MATIADLGAEAARQHRDFGADSLIVCDRLVRIYLAAGIEVQALQGLDLLVSEGEMVALVGASGSGKSTLMNILSFGLIPILSAAENVGVPLRITGMAPKDREDRVRLMLDIVGLGEHARQRPGELSGGQQQRVAIARALAASPQLLLADEPTGQLDSETAKQIMRLLHAVVESENVTALVATHDPNLISIADSVLELQDGTIKTDLSRTYGRASPPPSPLGTAQEGHDHGQEGAGSMIMARKWQYLFQSGHDHEVDPKLSTIMTSDRAGAA